MGGCSNLNLTIRLDKFVIILLCTALVFELWFSEEIVFLWLTLCISALFFIKNFEFSLGSIFALYLFVVLSSFIVGLFFGEAYMSIKDVWYFLKPLFYLYFSFIVMRVVSLENVLKLFIAFSVIYGIYYSIPIVISGDFINLTPDEYRDIHGVGSLIFAFSCILLLEMLSKNRSAVLFILIAINFTFIAISSSRLSFLILFLYFSFRVFPILFSRRYFSVLVVFLLYMALPKDSGGIGFIDYDMFKDNFFNKVMFSIDELRPQELFFDSEIHSKWRGYETFLALEQFNYSSPSELLFGKGFGTPVYSDFPKRARDTDDVLFQLEWLHNGFVTVFFKSGLIGLLVVISIFYIYLPKSPNLFSMALFIAIISTFLFGGLLGKSDVFITIFFISIAKKISSIEIKEN